MTQYGPRLYTLKPRTLTAVRYDGTLACARSIHEQFGELFQASGFQVDFPQGNRLFGYTSRMIGAKKIFIREGAYVGSEDGRWTVRGGRVFEEAFEPADQGDS